jgi:hypothetical protein
MDHWIGRFPEETGLDTTRRCQDIRPVNVVGLCIRAESGTGIGWDGFIDHPVIECLKRLESGDETCCSPLKTL